MNKTVEVRHERDMRLVARTGSGHDVPFDDGESDSAARPTEVLLSALAACSAMDVVSIMEKKRQAYDSYVIHVTAVQRDEYPQVFTRIDLVHEIVGDEVEAAQLRRCIELSATKYCPINAMVSAGETEVHHRFRLVRPTTSNGPTGAAEEGEVLVTGPFWHPEPIAR